MSFSWGGSVQHSPSHQSAALLGRVPSAPVRWLADAPAADEILQRPASNPYMPFPASFFSTADSNNPFLDAALASSAALSVAEDAAVASADAAAARRSAAHPKSVSPEGSVVDAVMDYLETLDETLLDESLGGGAIYAGELEAVVDRMDFER
mmetsp:Transcript_11400/g.26792  ORF Transcript_11400/g.26792 Transcript_11400/m.26792 type:complete len:152 (+) Transcript_11400:1-456(+)